MALQQGGARALSSHAAWHRCCEGPAAAACTVCYQGSGLASQFETLKLALTQWFRTTSVVQNHISGSEPHQGTCTNQTKLQGSPCFGFASVSMLWPQHEVPLKIRHASAFCGPKCFFFFFWYECFGCWG